MLWLIAEVTLASRNGVLLTSFIGNSSVLLDLLFLEIVSAPDIFSGEYHAIIKTQAFGKMLGIIESGGEADSSTRSWGLQQMIEVFLTQTFVHNININLILH